MEEFLVICFLSIWIPILVLLSIPMWIVYGLACLYRSVVHLVFGNRANDSATENGQG